jgi:peptide-methionine (S)-S-oxide reductase
MPGFIEEIDLFLVSPLLLLAGLRCELPFEPPKENCWYDAMRISRKHEVRSQMASSNQVATFGGGCFWCLEAVFKELRGVIEVVSGYAGGSVKNPSYRDVCSGRTGHAEVVQITFDPGVISYRDLLRIFFSIHDPTTLNRQGADVGTQYRSVIFWHDEAQKQVAQETIRELSDEGVWKAPIVTQVLPLEAFYRAEDYHQNYFDQNPNQPYCQAVVAPKLAKFRKLFAEKRKRS